MQFCFSICFQVLVKVFQKGRIEFGPKVLKYNSLQVVQLFKKYSRPFQIGSMFWKASCKNNGERKQNKGKNKDE